MTHTYTGDPPFADGGPRRLHRPAPRGRSGKGKVKHRRRSTFKRHKRKAHRR